MMMTKAIKTAVFLGLCGITLGMSNPWVNLAKVDTEHLVHLKKIYVDTSQIHLATQGIMVQADHSIDFQPALYHDDQGFFIERAVEVDLAEDHSHHITFNDGDCAHPSCPYYYDLLEW